MTRDYSGCICMDKSYENLAHLPGSSCNITEDVGEVLLQLAQNTAAKEDMNAEGISSIVGVQLMVASQGAPQTARTPEEIASKLKTYLNISELVMDAKYSKEWAAAGINKSAADLMDATELYAKKLGKMMDDSADPCRPLSVPGITVMAEIMKVRKGCEDFDSKGKDLRMPAGNSSATLAGTRPRDSVSITQFALTGMVNASEFTIVSILFDRLGAHLPQSMTAESRALTNNTRVLVGSRVFAVSIDPPIAAEFMWGAQDIVELDLELSAPNTGNQKKVFCSYFKFDKYFLLSYHSHLPKMNLFEMLYFSYPVGFQVFI